MHYPLIIPAGQRDGARDSWAVLDPDSGGAETFSLRLSADGSLPATHYGAYSVLEPETVAALQDTNVNFQSYVNALAIERERTAPGTVGFKNSLLMGEAGENFDTFAAANGLQRAGIATDDGL